MHKDLNCVYNEIYTWPGVSSHVATSLTINTQVWLTTQYVTISWLKAHALI